MTAHAAVAEPPSVIASSRERVRTHATRRMWQRFGRVLAVPDYEALCAAAARGTYLPSGHHGRVFVPVTFRALSLIAIYDTGLAAIVSFVPALPAGKPGERRG